MVSCGKCKQNRGILVVIPLSEKYLSLVRGFFPQNSKTSRYWFLSNLPEQ
jgi:hypothetical protein